MHMFAYLVLAVLIYWLLADRTDRATERELMRRRPDDRRLGLVEDFDERSGFPRFQA